MIDKILNWICSCYRKVAAFILRLKNDASFRQNCRKEIEMWWKANRWATLISLGLAASIYLAIREMIDNVFELPMQVEIQAKEGEEPLAVSPSSVIVTLRGAYKDYANANSSIRKVWISRSDVGAFDDEGKVVVKIRENAVKGVSGLSIQKIYPEKVEVKRDRIGTFEFDVAEPKPVGDPISGHAQLSFANTNNTVVVQGGVAQLEKLKEISYKFELAAVDVSGLGDDTKQENTIYREVSILPPTDNSKLTITPKALTVKIVIRKEGTGRHLEQLPVRLAFPPDVSFPAASDVVIKPSLVDVTLTGWSNITSRVSADNVAVYANVAPEMLTLPDEGETTNSIPLRILSPSDISIWSTKIEPDHVSLILKAQPKDVDPPVDESDSPAAEVGGGNDSPAVEGKSIAEPEAKADSGVNDGQVPPTAEPPAAALKGEEPPPPVAEPPAAALKGEEPPSVSPTPASADSAEVGTTALGAPDKEN